MERIRRAQKKRKKRVIAPGLCMLALCFLSGCGDKEDMQDHVQDFAEAESMAVQEDLPDDVSFPKRYENTIENVRFNMDIIVDADLSEEPPVTAKARMKKADAGQAFEL